VDWARFADQWRNGYAPSLEKVRRGELSWTKLDVLHRMLLEDLERDIEKTIPDKNAPIVLYCGGGFRSALGRRASAHRA
jgi:rhodanese-related sulfurtransferase